MTRVLALAALVSLPLWLQPAMALTVETPEKNSGAAAGYADPESNVKSFGGSGGARRSSPFEFNVIQTRPNTPFGRQRDGTYNPGTGLAPLMDIDRDREQRR